MATREFLIDGELTKPNADETFRTEDPAHARSLADYLLRMRSTLTER